MADSSYSLLSLLKDEYPTLPIFTVLKVLKKYEHDEERCRQALESEAKHRENNPDSDSFQASTASQNTNSNNNLESPNDGRPLTPRNKDTLKAHEGSQQHKPVTPERHISTMEASIGNASRLPEQAKRPYMEKSVSWNVQPPDRPPSAQPGRSANSSVNTPQSAPPDFTPFFAHSAKDIPNINCSTSGFGPGHGGAALFGNRPPQLMPSPPTSSNPVVEPRHPVKVINIPPGSLSGGSVYRAPAPSNSRRIRMHFGDTGGICTISSPPSTPQHYGSTPNVNQQYRSELRTETPASHPVHSSSIVVDTSSHVNNLIPERKISASSSSSDLTVSGRRTPIPPSSFKTGDLLSGSGAAGGFPSGRLSTPVQASSPGIAHSRPVFVEIKSDRAHGAYNDTSYTPGFYQVGNVRPPPSNMGFNPYQGGHFNAQSSLPNYNIQHYGQDFPNHANSSLGLSQQEQRYSQNAHQLKPPNFNSPPQNLYQPPTSTNYSPTSYSQFNNPANVMGYPLIYFQGHNPGISTSPLQHFTQYGQHAGHPVAMNMPKSPSIGIGQLSLGSRSNSQDTEHSVPADFDPRHYNAMGSRVSSHGSLNSDSSSGRMDRMDTSTRSRSGSVPDDAEYIRALVQHQKSQVQKLLDEMNNHKVILDKLRTDVGMMEKDKIEAHDSRSFPSAEDISRMCQSNRRLQTDIQLYMNEIDMYRSGQTPLDKINPRDQQNFFDNMPTGQQDPIYSRTPDDRSPSPRPIPPPRPPPPLPARQRSTDPGLASGGVLSTGDMLRVPPVPPTQPVINSGDSEEGESWNCSACTFSNHPALKKCEMCEMPRVVAPNQSASVLSPFNPSSHQPVSPFLPRLPPGLVGNVHHRSASPHSTLGHQHHHAGT